MKNRLIVSTQCPSCGASLDFDEGANAIRCEYCRSNLLVTGRGRILSYYVEPKLDARQAAAKVRGALGTGQEFRKVIKAQLYFLPYYRITGHDFIWRLPAAKRREPLDSILSSFGEPMSEHEVEFVGISDRYSLPGQIFLGHGESSQEAIEFQERYLEKNFLACDLPATGAYSLGVRPSVLRLKLFHGSAIQTQGRWVNPTLDSDAAMAHGLEIADSEQIHCRQVLAVIISIIYFPFWVVETERQDEILLHLLDGVSGMLTGKPVPTSLYQLMEKSSPVEPEVAGFRPLVCPNCAWDLPLRPDDLIFYCASCRCAWRAAASDLVQVDYQIGEGPEPATTGVKRFLPFWILKSGAQESQPPFIVPAFRCRRLKWLLDTARQMTHRQATWTPAIEENPNLQDCYYDPEDAARLADFVITGSQKIGVGSSSALSKPFCASHAGLVWLPFYEQGGMLLNPFTGTAFQSALLK